MFFLVPKTTQNEFTPTRKLPKKESLSTPPKMNIEPENDGLEDVSPFRVVYSQVPC